MNKYLVHMQGLLPHRAFHLTWEEQDKMRMWRKVRAEPWRVGRVQLGGAGLTRLQILPPDCCTTTASCDRERCYSNSLSGDSETPKASEERDTDRGRDGNPLLWPQQTSEPASSRGRATSAPSTSHIMSAFQQNSEFPKDKKSPKT